MKRVRVLGFVCATVTCLVLIGARRVDAGTLYRVIKLERVAGPLMRGTVGHGINDAGETVGFTSGPIDHYATRWSNVGAPAQVPFLLPYGRAWANAINNVGEIAGRDYSNIEHYHACYWDMDGIPTSMGTLNAPFPGLSDATAINDFGEVVGWSTSVAQVEAFRWSPAIGMVGLGTLPGGEISEANDINNAGQIVGYSSTPELTIRAFLYDNGAMTNLGAIDEGAASSVAYGINDQGDVVGLSYVEVDASAPLQPYYSAFIHRDGEMIELAGTIFWRTIAIDINNAGEVIGHSNVFGEPWVFDSARSWVWRNGEYTDLSVASLPAGEWQVNYAEGINDSGEIVATAQYLPSFDGENTQIWAVKLIPLALGDANCDGARNGSDIAPFVQAILDPSAYAARHPDCDVRTADLNRDGTADAADIPEFISALQGE